MSHIKVITALVACAAVAALAQSTNVDPLNNFCRRFAHQTCVIDNKLYIDGGYVDYGTSITSSTANLTNTFLLYADTSVVNDGNFPPEYDNLTKPANAPSVAGGTLWADEVNKVFYLFGGEYNSTTAPPNSFNLWSFDTIYSNWTGAQPDSSFSGITPPSFGGSAVDQNRGFAYYYGGWKSNATTLGYSGNATAQNSLVQFDLSKRVWRSAPFIDNTGRAEGALFYIPASDAGLLVYFGGIQQFSNGTTAGVPMNTIYIYDIASSTAYTQTTTGGPPPMRRRFCGGVSWPEDRSSYNFYFYGGLNATNGMNSTGFGYGDAWVLSLPSFRWINIYNPSATDARPHHSLSCDVVNNGQMIIMGGYFPNSTDDQCDVPTIWGMHNMNLGANDAVGALWYQYLPNITDYTVLPNITEVIGGSSTGGAAVVTPAGGFGSNDLQVYFGRKAPTGSRTATRAVPTSTTSTSPPPATSTSSGGDSSDAGAIAGGVVGGVAGLALIAGLILFCLRRRRQRRMTTTAQPRIEGGNSPPTPMVEAPTPSMPYGGHTQHKREASTSTYPATTPSPAFTPPTQQTAHWTHIPAQQPPQGLGLVPQPQRAQQQFYNPPQPQQAQITQTYYPTPPPPQRYDQQQQQDSSSMHTYEASGSPVTHEMPNVRSPANAYELQRENLSQQQPSSSYQTSTFASGGGNHSPRVWRGERISEE